VAQPIFLKIITYERFIVEKVAQKFGPLFKIFKKLHKVNQYGENSPNLVGHPTCIGLSCLENGYYLVSSFSGTDIVRTLVRG
jgi:hypothetical protein